jgi:phosphatidylserine/phosphatidylglycerophosphate/cardiolipin synthase-like enzyme
MKLLVQPEDGIEPLLKALNGAKRSIRILIFRFDRVEIEKALVAALQRGVNVQALIAYTNQGEEKNLRRLEMRLLAQGITVMRTADDLVRYHGKMMIVDDKTLYLLAYNFTHLDIDLSRSFGIVSTKPAVVKEAIKLFEADSHRQPYECGSGHDLAVSPVNARERLTEFIKGAKKRILLYEMKISDRDFLKLLNKKISEGVEVRILARASAKSSNNMPVRRMTTRLHLRAILRDGDEAFVGSMSLRKLELEARREIGILFKDKEIVSRMEDIFEKDWKKSEPALEQNPVDSAFTVPAKKVAKEVAKLLSVKDTMTQVLDKMIDANGAAMEPSDLAQTVRDAFREEMQDAVVAALHDMVAKSVQTDPE